MLLGERIVWPQVVSPADRTESESVTLRQALDHEESVDLDAIWPHDFTTEQLQLVAWVLSKSVILAEYESRVARNFDHVEPLAVELQSRQRGGPSMKKLLELLQNRRSHRVEWYIVILIVFEILLTLYEMFVRHQ